MVLEALNILRGLDLRGMGHNSAAYIHAVTEALKLAAADREVYFGDPAFVDVPLDILLSDDYAARRRARIDPAKAWPGMPPAGRGRRRVDPAMAPRSFRRCAAGNCRCAGRRRRSCASPTTHGNVFAATPSDPTISRAGGAGHRDHRLDVGFARLHRRRTIRRASVPDGGRACRPIRRSRSSPASW